MDRIFFFCDLCRSQRNRQPLDNMIATAMENYFNCHRKNALNKFCPLYKAPLVSISPPMDLPTAPSSVFPPQRQPDVTVGSTRSGEYKGKRTRRGCRSGKLCKELKKRKFDHFSSRELAPPLSSSSLHISQPNPNPNFMPPQRKVAKVIPSQPQTKLKPSKVTTVGEKLFDKFLKGVVTDEKMKLSSDVHTQDLPSTSASSDFNEKKMGSSSMEDIFHPQVSYILDVV